VESLKATFQTPVKMKCYASYPKLGYTEERKANVAKACLNELAGEKNFQKLEKAESSQQGGGKRD